MTYHLFLHRQSAYLCCNFTNNRSKRLHIIPNIELIIIYNTFSYEAHNFLQFLLDLLIKDLYLVIRFEKCKIKHSPWINFVAKDVKCLHLHIDEFLFADFLMHYFLVNCWCFQWVNLLHFWCYVHWCHSQNM